MKKFLFVLSKALTLATCKKDPIINTPSFTDATVIGIGGDCGDTYLIKFEADAAGLP